MSCHELNEQNEASNDEDEKYEEENEIPKYVVKEFWQFENQHKPNLEETETVNLGDKECVKEVKISVHLNEAQTSELIHLLTKYIDVFFRVYKLPINPRFNLVKQNKEVQA